MAGTVNGIVAGYDGSAASQEALDWAAREARTRGLVLTVCHVWGRAVPSDAVADLAWKYGECVMARGVQHAQAAINVFQLIVNVLLAADSADHDRARPRLDFSAQRNLMPEV